jgi:hypothetical protein
MHKNTHGWLLLYGAHLGATDIGNGRLLAKDSSHRVSLIREHPNQHKHRPGRNALRGGRGLGRAEAGSNQRAGRLRRLCRLAICAGEAAYRIALGRMGVGLTIGEAAHVVALGAVGVHIGIGEAAHVIALGAVGVHIGIGEAAHVIARAGTNGADSVVGDTERHQPINGLRGGLRVADEGVEGLLHHCNSFPVWCLSLVIAP